MYLGNGESADSGMRQISHYWSVGLGKQKVSVYDF